MTAPHAALKQDVSAASPLRGALSFCNFFFGQAKKKFFKKTNVIERSIEVTSRYEAQQFFETFLAREERLNKPVMLELTIDRVKREWKTQNYSDEPSFAA